MIAADAGAQMLISFREAADLTLQILIAMSVVASATALATVTAKSQQKPRPLIDVSRPALWEDAPTRIDRHERLASLGKPAAPAGKTAGAPCSNAIGLRVACDLVASSRRPS